VQTLGQLDRYLSEDIRARGDAIESFQSVVSSTPYEAQAFKAAEDIQILLKGLDDNLKFASMALEKLALINHQAGAPAGRQWPNCASRFRTDRRSRSVG
jgi:hypothetical protein